MQHPRKILTFTLAVSIAALSARASIAQDHDHGHQAHENQHAQKAENAAEKRIGDPYPLAEDVVNGESLAEIDKPVVFLLHGREIRFTDEKSLETFKAHTEEYLIKIDDQIIKQQTPLYPMETCLVSGEQLGAMGDPYDIVFGNRLVQLCCKGCVSKFKKDSEKYLDTLNQAVIKKQLETYPMQTCVVSGETLGGMMGEPIDYVAANRLVRFCCKGCIKKFEKKPAKYLMMVASHEKQGAESDEGGQMHNHEDHGGG
ncbi:MAG: hypothetical protein HND57_02220 [Planctomycetes bacterium]|nr:hypothetical protein [Planctomycetota bacterium]